MSEFSKATDAPYVLKVDSTEYIFPRLKLRSFGTLIEKYRAEQLERAKKLLESQKLEGTAKAELLSSIALADYPIEQLFDWALRLNGSIQIAKESLMQSGKTLKEANDLVDTLDPEQIRIAAMESLHHPLRPSANKKDEKKDDKGDNDPNAVTADQ